MIRAVLDSNVIVAGLIKSTGLSGEILTLLRDGAFTAVFSGDLVDEIAAVLAYPKLKMKYRLGRKDLEAIAGLFSLRGELVETVERVGVCRDPNDDFLIEAAVAGNAAYLVTGDEDLLALKRFRQIRIVRPRAFLETFKPSGL